MKKIKRQNRTRYKLKKVTNRKRLSVFKSNNHIYAQIINDELGVTIASASSMEKSIRSEKQTRKELAERQFLIAKNIDSSETTTKVLDTNRFINLRRSTRTDA